MMPGSSYSLQYMEIVGKVEQDGSIQEFSYCDLGQSFDLKNYDSAVQLMQQHPTPFYS